MFIAKFRIVIMALLLPLYSEISKAASAEEHLSRYFMVDDVVIKRAMREDSLGLARYREQGPVIILEVARSGKYVFYYAEVNDLGGVLLGASLDFSDIRTILQAHSIACPDILKALRQEAGLRSICRGFKIAP